MQCARSWAVGSGGTTDPGVSGLARDTTPGDTLRLIRGIQRPRIEAVTVAGVRGRREGAEITGRHGAAARGKRQGLWLRPM